MITDFLEKPIIVKEIPKECPFDMFLLENCEKQIGQICDFLQGDEKLMMVNGFKGVGKSLLVDFITTYLNHNCLVLKYNCLETTILDDMLLSFLNHLELTLFKAKLFLQELRLKILLKR